MALSIRVEVSGSILRLLRYLISPGGPLAGCHSRYLNSAANQPTVAMDSIPLKIGNLESK